MNVGGNIVDLINVSKNYEKPIVDFGSTAFSHAKLMPQVTSLTFKRTKLLPLT